MFLKIFYRRDTSDENYTQHETHQKSDSAYEY